MKAINKVIGYHTIIVFVLMFIATTSMSRAQTFTTLVNFDGSNGAFPEFSSLVQSADGHYYGTTGFGGANGNGTVFKLGADGNLTTLYSFCSQTNCADGSMPFATVIQATDGNFYGTTYSGGTNGDFGTIFKLTPKGVLTTLHSFDLSDGAQPEGALVQATDGNFYGTTSGGGPNNEGTVFVITATGTLTTLYFFDGSNGTAPACALVQGKDGGLYGTTPDTVFKITTGGSISTLHAFSGSDGNYLCCDLIQATDGQFYGTTGGGGANNSCNNGCGTVFKITAQGILTTLHNFDSTAGYYPTGGLAQGTDGNFYGTTYAGGTTDWGTVYEMSPAGTVTTLHSFDETDGAQPHGQLVQSTSGLFYGLTPGGGSSGQGVVYTESIGLAPFIKFLREAAKVGQTIGILGQGLTGTTSVSFGAVPANFKVKSDNYLTATVPAGALTASVKVITASGTLRSNKAFRVTPQLLSFSPTSGPIGTVVTLIGVSLTQAAGVGFGDYIPATFSVNSDTQITATVPSGAKTGRVGVQTPGGTAISSATFTVTE
jgi:uncharacterized repeat protein (TIGR03803 family)